MPISLVCVDASLIIRFLLPGEFRIETWTKFELWRQTETQLIAPALIEYEVSASIRRMVYHKSITPIEGDDAFAALEDLHFHLSSDRTLHHRAWQLAKRFNQSRTHDMTYVALAELNNCPFWTADERLYNSVRQQLSWVHWIGETT